MVGRKGDRTDFWQDSWCSDLLLGEKFTNLLEICNEQKSTVAQLAQTGWRLTSRRWLGENLQNHLKSLRDILTDFAVNEEEDYPKWNWEKSHFHSEIHIQAALLQ